MYHRTYKLNRRLLKVRNGDGDHICEMTGERSHVHCTSTRSVDRGYCQWGYISRAGDLTLVELGLSIANDLCGFDNRVRVE